jgi:hypothetical protein
MSLSVPVPIVVYPGSTVTTSWILLILTNHSILNTATVGFLIFIKSNKNTVLNFDTF